MLKSADTEVLSFAEGTLEVWAFVPEEGELRGLLTNTTNDKSFVLRETSPQAELTILLHVNVWNQVKQFLWFSAAVDLYLVLMPLKLSLRIELKLDRPLSLTGEACDVVSRPRSSFTAESGLSGSEL